MKPIKYLFLLLIFIALLINGCKECKVNSDCNSKAREMYKGYSTSCLEIECNVNNKCGIDGISNCCGNKNCEKSAGENECTCSKDCGECEGKGKVKIGSREHDAEYLKYDCGKDNECKLMVDGSLITPISLTDDKELSCFIIELKSFYDYPFNIDNSNFYIEIKLKDTDEDLILPISITYVKLIEKELLIGEAEVDETLSGVGDSLRIKIPITFNMQEIEEEKRLSLVIDYTYKKKEKIGRSDDGDPIYDEKTVRDSYEKSYSSKIFFVNPD